MFSINVIGKVEARPNAAGTLTRGAREVLAYLVLHGPSMRVRVASDIWPDSEVPLALYNLRRALTDLRRNLGPEAQRLQALHRSRIALDLDGVRVDLQQFRKCFAERAYSELVVLCGGTPLEDVSGKWAVPLRQAIRSELTQGLVVAARQAAEQHGLQEAEALLKAAIRYGQQPRSVWQSLVRLHSEAGDFKAARRVLAECESALLGREAPPVAVPASGLSHRPELPVRSGELVGREDVLQRLTSDLREYRLVTLCGAGGMGKTRTAIALASRIDATLPDGAVFVELVGATAETSVRDAIIRALGLRFERGDPWRQAVDWLAQRQILLVLDNAEHILVPMAEIALELLGRTTNARLLVTSRVPLGLPDERRRRLPRLRRTDARELFTRRASAADPEYCWSEASERLCARLDGIPLAIELAAAQVASFPLERLSAGFARSLTLDSPCEGRPERHRTMRAALQLSLRALTFEERRTFVALSVFSEGFELDAAIAVAGVSLSGLNRLVTASLLEFDGERYRMLEPVRQLAAEEITLSRAEEMRERHASWFAQVAERAYERPFPYDLDPQRYAQDRKSWQAEGSNLRTAQAYLEERGQGLSDRSFALLLVQFWYRLVEHSDPLMQTWLDRLDAEPPGTSRNAAHWWLAVGLAALWNDQGDRARAHLARLSEPIVRAGRLDVYAEICMAFGAHPVWDVLDEEPRTGHEIAARTFASLKMMDSVRHAKVVAALARAPQELVSEETWREISEIATESLERNEVRTHVLALRMLACRETHWVGRQAILLRALRLQRSVGHWAEVHTLRALGMAARELGTVEDEIHAWRGAVQRGQEIGYMGTLAEAHLELARACLRGGRMSEAWDSIACCLGMIRSQNRPAYLHLAITHLADLARLAGETDIFIALVAYLRRAYSRGVFEPHPKFEQIYPRIVAAGESPGSSLFATSDAIIEWTKIRAAVEAGRSVRTDNGTPAQDPGVPPSGGSGGYR